MNKETWVVLVWRRDDRNAKPAEWPEVLGVYHSEGDANAAINEFRLKPGCGINNFDILLS